MMVRKCFVFTPREYVFFTIFRPQDHQSFQNTPDINLFTQIQCTFYPNGTIIKELGIAIADSVQTALVSVMVSLKAASLPH